MTKKLTIAFAAGLLLTGRALADDAGKPPATDPGEPQVTEQAKDPVQHQPASMDRTREQAHERVHDALAAQAGMPADHAMLPGGAAGDQAADRHAAQVRKMETERAAMRHTGRRAAREQSSESQATRHGAGSGGHGGMMSGSGPGAGDCMQAAETTRTGGMTGSGGMGGGGGMMR